MKSKEHTKEVRDEVVEKFKAGLGYKKISQALNVSRSTVRYIILKWKENGTTANLPRHGRPRKLTGPTRRALIRDAVKRPMMTLDELQKSAAQAGECVHRTTISRVLQKYGIREKQRNLCSQSPKKKTKAKVNAAKPKIPMSAMFIFSEEKHSKLQEEQPDLTDSEVTQLLAQMWNELPDEEKKKYKQLEAVQKAESENEEKVDCVPDPPGTELDFWQQIFRNCLARSSKTQDSEEEVEGFDDDDDDNIEDCEHQKDFSNTDSSNDHDDDDGNSDVKIIQTVSA